MGIVVQFKPKQPIPAVPLSIQPTTFDQRGDGPSFDPGAFGVFLDRARRKRNADSGQSFACSVRYPSAGKPGRG